MPSLLIVEDSEPIRFGMTEYFTARGYQVDAAAELEGARAILKAREYDLVITDLRLSDQVEGLDVVAEVRDHHPGTRVILLTAYGSPAVEAAAAHLGVSVFLQKPIRLAELEQVAVELLGFGRVMETTGPSLESLLAPGVIRTVFHPIYEIDAGRGASIWAVEALARGPAGTALETAGALFEFVRQKRAEPHVDRACARAALQEASSLPGSPAVALNVHAATLGRDPDFVRYLAEVTDRNGFTAERVIVDVVVQTPTWSGPTFTQAIDQLRRRGFRVALDDLGVGHSNLKLLLDLRPQVLKVDGSIIRGCHSDYYRWALVEWTHTLATRLGAWSLAEGVEDRADLAAVSACGIRLVQGHVFGPALPAAEIASQDLLARGKLVLSDLPVETA